MIAWGVPLGLLASLWLVVPGIGDAARTEVPGDVASTGDRGDPGEAMARAAGCDMTQPEIMMEVSSLDYIAGFGYPSVEEALVSSIGYLRQNGIAITRADLVEAASGIPTAPDLPRGEGDPASSVEIRLQGASILVVRNSDGWLVGEVVHCV